MFDKSPNPFMTESLSNNVERNFLNLKKGKHETPTTDVILNCE